MFARKLSISGSLLVFVGLGMVVNSASAQVLTSRYTKLNHNYVFGAGGDSNTGDDLWERSDIEPSSSHGLTFTDSTSGSMPNPYTAAVDVDINFTTTVTGSLPTFTGITSVHDTDCEGVASGAGSALMFSNNPGNMSEMIFSLARPRRYSMVGLASQVGGGFSEVTVRRWDGFAWTIFQTTLFLPGSVGSFNWAGTMPIGQFKVTSSSGANAFNDHRVAHADYDLQMLPSPVVINGRVTLTDYVASMANEVVTIELKNNLGVMDVIPNVPLTANGDFSFSTALTGWHWLRIRGLTWVAHNSGWYNLVDGVNTATPVILQNGDVDASNEVDAADIDEVIAHFGENTGGGPYFRPADLDGSTEVDATDIDIAIAHFGDVEN
ncbi:MAG: hypothetical protein IT205_03745 [Fimbriimonadaceae bacterium]|nr:hypothetical protein [Fimbriimonadaceae bacterium]